MAGRVSAGSIYRKFRSGRFFLYFLSTFCACWLLFDWRTNFDPDYGLYNVILSTEASLNGTIIVMMAEGFERWVRDVLGMLRQVLAGNKAMMEALAVEVEQQRDLTETVLGMLKERPVGRLDVVPVDPGDNEVPNVLR